jgi:hypothetical protein
MGIEQAEEKQKMIQEQIKEDQEIVQEVKEEVSNA